MRIVLDTNVYLAATKSNGYAASHLMRCSPNGPYELFISPQIIVEVQEKLVEKINFTSEQAGKFIEMIMIHAQLVFPKTKVDGVLADKDDHIILECADEVKAEVIFSADKGLLKLKKYNGATIAHPTMMQYWLI